MNNKPAIHFEFVDEHTNQTMELEGFLDTPNLHDKGTEYFNSTTENRITSTKPPRFDAGPTGPMLYVLAVIFVYGLSMFLIVGTLARKKSYHKQLDVEFQRYIKGLEAARQEAKLEQVNLTRLKWPGNFIKPFKQGSENDSASSERELPISVTSTRKHGSQMFSDTNQNTSDECLVLPATTVNMLTSHDSEDDKNSEMSECIILPATTVIVVDEATDKSTSQIHLHTEEQDSTKLTVPNFYLPKPENAEKELKFVQSHYYASSDFATSNFSLREATCLSTEDIHKTNNFRNNSNSSNMSRVQSFSQQDIASVEKKKKHNFLFSKRVCRSHSINETNSLTLEDDYNRKLNGIGSFSDNTKDTQNSKSPAVIPQRRKKKHSTLSSKINKSLQSSPLIKRSHRKPPQKVSSLDKQRESLRMPESAESSDDAMLEEYRKSKHYKMRGARGRRLTEDNERPVSVSSIEGSPKLHKSGTNRARTAVLNDNDAGLTDQKISMLAQMRSPQTVGPSLSDASDVEDPLFERYKCSNSYQSRTRGRRAALF